MKKRIFAAAAALMTGILSAAPVSAATTFNAMKKAVYHAHFGKGQAFYEELSDRWYRVTGEPLQPDRTWFRDNEDGYTCDTEQMVVYNPDGSENAALSIICKDLMTSEIFTFTQCNGEAIYANTPENALAQRMRASMPVARQLSLEKNRFRCLCVANSMPVIAIDAVLDDAFNMTDISYDRFGDIYIDSYTNTGDVNLDGRLTVSDAVILARIAAEDTNLVVSELGLTLSDLTADGLTDAGDVTAALRSIAGLDNKGTEITNPPVTTTQPAETTVTSMTSTTATTVFPTPTTGFPSTPEGYVKVEFEMTAEPSRCVFRLGEQLDLSGARFSARYYDPIGNIELTINNELMTDFPEYIKFSGDALTADQPGIYDLIITFDAGEELGSSFRTTKSCTYQIEWVADETHPVTTTFCNTAEWHDTTFAASETDDFTAATSTTTGTAMTGIYNTSPFTSTTTTTTTAPSVTIPPIATLPVQTTA